MDRGPGNRGVDDARELGVRTGTPVRITSRRGESVIKARVVAMPQYPCGKCALCLAGDYIYCQDVVDFTAFSGAQDGHATMAQYILKPDWLLVPIPDNMSYEHAVMAC